MHRKCKHTHDAHVTCICVRACIVHVVCAHCTRNNGTHDAIVICIGVHVCIVIASTHKMQTSHVFVCRHVSHMSCVINVLATMARAMQSQYVSMCM